MPIPDKRNGPNGAGFGQVMARHSQIEAVLCGHVHRDFTFGWKAETGLVSHLSFIGDCARGPGRGAVPPQND